VSAMLSQSRVTYLSLSEAQYLSVCCSFRTGPSLKLPPFGHAFECLSDTAPLITSMRLESAAEDANVPSQAALLVHSFVHKRFLPT